MFLLRVCALSQHAKDEAVEKSSLNGVAYKKSRRGECSVNFSRNIGDERNKNFEWAG